MSPTQRRSLWCALLPAGLAVAGLTTQLRAEPAPTRPEDVVGRKVAAFRLPDSAGKVRTLDEFKDRKAVVLVFIGASCPISNSYAEPLAKLDAAFKAQGVQFLAVNANPGENLQTVAQHAREFRYPFPVLKDEKQALARQVLARATPEALVLDAQRVVRYRGRIDDQYASRTQKNAQVKSHDLQEAIEAVLAGKTVAKAVTPVFGCAIMLDNVATVNASVTYHRDVERILQERCQGCHRPGQIAPFSLLTYADARSWAQEIKEFTANRQMPPWKPEPGHGDFLGVRRLSDDELKTLAKWADEGAVEGDPKDAPAPKQWASDWMLGKPDLVLQLPRYEVAASGDDDFRCFALPTELTQDRNVVGIEIRPGNPRVLHHVLNFIDTTGAGRKLDEKDPGPGYSSGPGGVGFFPQGIMGGWAPGNLPRYFPKGTAGLLPKGSDLVIQVHYHKTGKPEVDQTTVGLYFAKEPVEKRLRMSAATTFFINIPPGAARHEVRASQKLMRPTRVMSVTPHMHLLGKEMKVTAKLPDGTTKELIWIKDWDYRWQDSYYFQEPVVLPKDAVIEMVAYFDNSTANPRNPNNPPKQVTFGEQTTDEMAFAFYEFVFEDESLLASAK